MPRSRPSSSEASSAASAPRIDRPSRTEWADYIGSLHGACSSTPGPRRSTPRCTAFDLRPGDEVITTSYTFAGTWQPILQQLRDPGLRRHRSADVRPRPRPDRGQIGPRTRAIIAVHIGGLPCDLDEILDIADRHGLQVIEDGCQAHGATYHGRQVGSFGSRLFQPELEQDPDRRRGRSPRGRRPGPDQACAAAADVW